MTTDITKIPPVVEFMNSLYDIVGNIEDNDVSLSITKLSFYELVTKQGSCYRYPCNDTIDQLELFNQKLEKLLLDYHALIDDKLNINQHILYNGVTNYDYKLLNKLSRCTHFKSLNLDDTCIICLETFNSDIVMLLCGHYLCSNCFQTIKSKWENNSYGECPYCKRLISDYDKLEFDKIESTFDLNQQLIDLMIAEKINRRIVESMYTIQFDRSMTKWSDQMFVFYIDRIETSDRKCILDSEKSSYQQILDCLGGKSIKQLRSILNIWRDDVYQCFYGLYQEVRKILESEFNLNSFRSTCGEDDFIIEWLIYKIFEPKGVIDKWINWLHLNESNISITCNIESDHMYNIWLQKSKKKLRQLIAFRFYKNVVNYENGNIDDYLPIDNIAELLYYLKCRCNLD